jgi:DNA-binding Xre family transcriptional regulator
MNERTKLQTILNHRDMTQNELYEIIKKNCKSPVAKYQINKICKGTLKNYQIPTLIKICQALGVTPNDIISKSDFLDLFNPDVQ